MRIVPDTPLSYVHHIFHKLGLRFFAVVEQGKFRGLITKKSFVRYVHVLHNAKGDVEVVRRLHNAEMIQKEVVKAIDEEIHKSKRSVAAKRWHFGKNLAKQLSKDNMSLEEYGKKIASRNLRKSTGGKPPAMPGGLGSLVDQATIQSAIQDAKKTGMLPPIMEGEAPEKVKIQKSGLPAPKAVKIYIPAAGTSFLGRLQKLGFGKTVKEQVADAKAKADGRRDKGALPELRT